MMFINEVWTKLIVYEYETNQIPLRKSDKVASFQSIVLKFSVFLIKKTAQTD